MAGLGLVRRCGKENLHATVMDRMISNTLDTNKGDSTAWSKSASVKSTWEITTLIHSGKILRRRDHPRAIDHVASVLADDSKLGHGIPEGTHHSILIIDE